MDQLTSHNKPRQDHNHD